MRTLLAVPAAVLVLAAAGCGSSNSGGSTPAPTSATPAATASGATAVTIKNFAFAPKDLTVKTGTKITWTNEDSTAHNVIAKDGAFKSATLQQGDAFTFTADKAGTYDYVCTFHPTMTATLTVTG